jgi:hypothetical protein
VLAHPVWYWEIEPATTENCDYAQPKLLGRNKAIGSVYGELFRDEAELKHKVRQLVGEAVGRG